MAKDYSHSKLELNSFYQKTGNIDKPTGNDQLSDDDSITNHKKHILRESILTS